MGLMMTRHILFILAVFLIGRVVAVELRPVVYAVGNEYIICVPLASPGMVSCVVGDRRYEDSVNGVLASRAGVRMLRLPQGELDRAGEYRLIYREMKERRPYFSVTGEPQEQRFRFKAVEGGGKLRYFFLADVHGKDDAAIKAGRYFGEELDFLVLGGDLSSDTSKPEGLLRAHHLAWGITGGARPVVYVRGNHEQWGPYSEEHARYLPTDHGRSHYTFRLGAVWGIVLDSGADKPDNHKEFGHTSAASAYRREVTHFLHQVAANAATEYAAPGVKRRLVFCHIPFTMKYRPPYNMDQELLSGWAKFVGQELRPDLMLFGHLHRCVVTLGGSEGDHFGCGVPFVYGGIPGGRDYIGTAVTMDEWGKIQIEFVGQNHHVYQRQVISGGKCQSTQWTLPDSAAAYAPLENLTFRLLDVGKGHGECAFSGGKGGFDMVLKNSAGKSNYAIACSDFNKVADSSQCLAFQLTGAEENISGHLQVNLLYVEGGSWRSRSVSGIAINQGQSQEIRLALDKDFGLAAGRYELVQLKLTLGGGKPGSTSRVSVRNVRVIPRAEK